jgi:hypothetical protein
MSTPLIERRGLWLAYQIVAAACTIVVGSAFVLAVIMLAVALCKHVASRDSDSIGPPSVVSEDAPASAECLTTEDLLGAGVDQTMHFRIDSVPPGAHLYSLDEGARIGQTPYSNEWSCSLDRWSYPGLGFAIKNSETGCMIRLNCAITKEGYESQLLTQILASVSQSRSARNLPSQINFTALLKPTTSQLKPAGRALLVNGRVMAGAPDGLKVTEGVYQINILAPDKAE